MWLTLDTGIGEVVPLPVELRAMIRTCGSIVLVTVLTLAVAVGVVNAGRILTPWCRLNFDPPGSVFDGYLVVLGVAGGGPVRCARVR